MIERLLFIQFMHAGKEHQPDTERTKYWNTGDHKRKFVKNAGIYLSTMLGNVATFAFGVNGSHSQKSSKESLVPKRAIRISFILSTGHHQSAMDTSIRKKRSFIRILTLSFLVRLLSMHFANSKPR
jgi:hypothetical protein